MSAAYTHDAEHPVKVAGLISSIVPYHHARWQAFTAAGYLSCLIELTSKNEFSVLEMADPSEPAYRRLSLFREQTAARLPRKETLRALWNSLESVRPDVVCVNGYASALSAAALVWCQKNRIPAIICSESNAFDELRNPLRESIKRRLVRICSAGLAGGRPQTDYLVQLGLPRKNVFTGYDVVDNEHFAAGAERVRAAGDRMRRQLGLPSRYFLTCSRFAPKKNLPRVLQAYARYRALTAASGDTVGNGNGSWDLVVVGDGPLRRQLETQIDELRLNGNVHLAGAKSYAELPAWYGLAGAFVHASTTEQWGLVVNEAMAAGLPVLVSNRCGCATDLVEDGRNGFLFAPEDVEQLAQAMCRIASPATDLESLGRESRVIVGHWGPSAFAQGLAAAVETAIRLPVPMATALDRVLLKYLMRRQPSHLA